MPAGSTAKQIHLPEAVLRHDVALGLREVFHGCGTDVRNAPEVTFDGNLVLETGQGNAAVNLRQRSVDIPPGCGAGRNHKNGKDPVEDPKNGPQIRSRAT